MAIQEATPIALTAAERATLTGWVRSGKTEHRLVERARIVLLAGDGWGRRAGAREGGGGGGLGPPEGGGVRQGTSCWGGGCAALRQTEDLRRGRRSAHPGAARPAA